MKFSFTWLALLLITNGQRDIKSEFTNNGGLDMKVVWIMSALFGNLKSEVYSLKWVKVVIWRCSKWCGPIGEVLKSGYYLHLVIWANVFKCQFGGETLMIL